MDKIKFIALGGMDEIGKNSFIIEVDEDIFIFDLGIKNPDFQNFGVDLIIPNFSYIDENISKIKGIFISNGHLYSIGSLPFIVKKYPNIPIYASPITTTIIENEFRRHKISNFNLIPIALNANLEFGSIIVKSFQLSGQLPQNLGYAIVKNNQQIIYMVDYMIENQFHSVIYQNNFQTLEKIISNAKTKLLITDAHCSKIPGYLARDNQTYFNGFKKVLKDNDQKLLVGVFSNHINLVHQMINYAISKNKKIIIYGRALNEVVKVLKEKNLINNLGKFLTSFTKINLKMNCVIFVSHSFFNLYRSLSKIANKKDDFVDINSDFNVYIASPPIPGAETFYYKIIDDFYRQKIRAHSVKNAKDWHPFAGDIKYVIDKVKPEIVLPVKGYFRDFVAFEKIAVSCGIKPKNVVLLDNGEAISIVGKEIIKNKKTLVPVTNQFVDGMGVGDVGETIVNERVNLGQYGALILAINIDAKSLKLDGQITLEPLGLNINKENIGKIKEKITDFIESITPFKITTSKKKDFKKFKNIIIKKLKNICRNKINEEPVIVAIILEKNHKRNGKV